METIEKIKDGIIIGSAALLTLFLMTLFIAVFSAILHDDDYIKNGKHCYNGWHYQISTGKCVR